MAAITLKAFSGEIPNLPPYLLPTENGQAVFNCDFAQKDLRPLKQGTVLNGTAFPSPIKGIYTEEGTNFFTWTVETAAYKSPVIGETYGRVYYLNSSGMQVAQYSTATSSGGPPSSSWLVGVPTPTAAGSPDPYKIKLRIKERTTLPDYPTISTNVDIWWESNGVQYQKQTGVALTSVTAWKSYSFTVPARTPYNDGTTATTTSTGTGSTTSVAPTGSPSGTPDDASLVAHITIKDTSVTPNITFFDVTVSSGATTPTQNLAFPGGVEVAVTTDGKLSFVWGVMETRAYAYTLTNTFGEESAPAVADVIDVTYMQEVIINTKGGYSSGGIVTPDFTGYRPYSTTKIYRTFGTAADYFNVVVTSQGSTIASTLEFLDSTYKETDVGSVLISNEFYPPESGMQNLVALPNGVFAAFKGNTLYLTEPYRPHAWPYQQTFPHTIRAICTASQALVVTTAAGAYLLMGSQPANMQQQRLPIPQAGLDSKLIINIEGSVVYASQDGLVAVSGSTASLDMSQKLFSREDWRSRYSSILTSGSTARMAYHDGFLVLVDSASALGFIIRLDEAAGTYTQFNQQFDGMFYLPVQDTLYYSVGGYIYRFRNDGYYTLDWQSKDFVFPSYTSFGAMYVRATASVTVTLYADGVQYYQFTAATTGYYRIPATGLNGATVTPGFALRWSVRLQSQNLIQYVTMATDMKELKDA
jgi:hypothetical protein